MSRINGTAEQRFWPKVDFTGSPIGCWVWLAAKDPNGYGRFQIGTTNKSNVVLAHRFAVGITDRKNNCVIYHKCDNPPCVNPNHLRVGSQIDNMKDAAQKGRLGGHGWSIKVNGRSLCKSCLQVRTHKPIKSCSASHSDYYKAHIERQRIRRKNLRR